MLSQAMHNYLKTGMAPIDTQPEWKSVRMAPIAHCAMLAGMMRMPVYFAEEISMQNMVSLDYVSTR